MVPTILIFAIILLEFGIGFLQAYVFTILLAIYFEETFILLKNYSFLIKSEHNPLILDYDLNHTLDLESN